MWYKNEFQEGSSEKVSITFKKGNLFNWTFLRVEKYIFDDENESFFVNKLHCHFKLQYLF
jgi:hypothetical protein